MKLSTWFEIVFLGSVVLSLVACSQVGDPGITNDTQLPPVADPISVNESQPKPEKNDTQMTQSTPSPGMEFLIDEAKKDLAQRLAIDVDDINVLEAREVVWPDASLGCPQPGMKYKQVPEDGALIILQYQGTTYEYHNGGSRGLFLCEIVYKDPNPPSKIDLTDLTPHLQEGKNPPPSTPDQGIPPGEDQ